MNVQDALRKTLDEVWRQQAHITGQADQINLVFPQNGNNLAIVRFALKPARRADLRCDSSRVGALNSLSAFSIGDNNSDVRIWNSARGNALRKSLKIRAASAQQHPNAFFHERKTLAQSSIPVKSAQGALSGEIIWRKSGTARLQAKRTRIGYASFAGVAALDTPDPEKLLAALL